jgi:VIT1/CCC1 family predicted Fe2+/Mn2+ transporter
VSGGASDPGPGPEQFGPPTSRWRDPDWWFGRTPEQRARRERASEEFRIARGDLGSALRDAGSTDPSAHQGRSRAVGQRITAVGKSLTIAVTLPIVAAAFFGPVGFIVAVLVAVLLLVGRGASHRER